MTWRDDATLWEDVARKSPEKARAFINLGFTYASLGFLDRAIAQYEIAVQRAPLQADVHHKNARFSR